MVNGLDYYLIIQLITMLSFKFADTSSHICPEWCECLTLNEIRFDNNQQQQNGQELKVTCEWSNFSNEMQRLQALVPPYIVARLSVKCRNVSDAFRLAPKTFSRFEKLRHLSMSNCRLDDKTLHSKIFDDLLTLKTLHLEKLSFLSYSNGDNSDLVITPSTLSALKSLEKLSIISSNLKTLPPGELCSLKELKSVNFSDNHLTSFADIGFGGCQTQLVILDLDRNRISTLHNKSLEDFASLRILRLNNNAVQQIATGTFQRTKQMRHLHLSNNKISNLDDLPPNLHNLDLSYNNLHMIPTSVVVHDYVTYLNLSHNFVDVNTPFNFRSANQLTILDMSYNRMETVPIGFFPKNSTNALTELLLNNNGARSLQASALQYLTNLRRLNLGHNKLTYLDAGHLNGLRQLEEFSLESNALSKFDENAFESTVNLLKLNLAGNIFTETPKCLSILKKLLELDISRNGISTIQEYLFLTLSQLTALNLSSNRLTSVERNCFDKMTKLQRLDLSDNSIERMVTNALEGDNELTDINLHNNLIRDINGAFANLQKLHVLNLSRNRIKHLDLTLLPYSLKTLIAYNNSISQVTNFLPAIRPLDLRHVDFAWNKLEKLSSSMLPSSLETANFSRNEISKLEKDALQDKTNLTLLDLSHNKLQTVNQFSLTVKSNVIRNQPFVVYLRENPFQCTCDMHWMKSAYAGGGNEALYVGSPSVGDFDRLKCNTIQRDDFYRPINNVSSEEFLCVYSKVCSDECNCCEFDFCDCKNVCPNSCVCYVDVTSTINTVECTNSFDGDVVTEKQVHSIPMYATTIRLDGVRLPFLNRNAFFGRFRLKQLYLNQSHVEAVAAKAFNGLTALELLDLSDNALETLTGHEFYNTPKVETLFLNGNRMHALQQTGFVNLPNLKYLTLHNNKFKTLPSVLVNADAWLQGLTLSNNPFKCDCDDKYILQTWLPQRVQLVTDNRAVYCYENLTESSNKSSNSSTILSLLPATSNTDVVKVNFWTFINKINQTFCHPKRKEYELEDEDDDVDDFDKMLILIPVVICGLFFVAILSVLLLWRYRNRLGKKFYDKYRVDGGGAGSSQSTGGSSLRSTNHNTSSPNTPTPPLLQYDAFVSYSKLDEDFVVKELVPQLEEVQPYYKLCLLHREFPITPGRQQYVEDDLINAMTNSQRVITVASRNFLQNEWDLLHIRTAYRLLLKNKHRQSLVTILLEHELPKSKDDVLGHYVRISQCYKWTDKMFWENFLSAMPVEPSNVYNNSSSSHYSDLYGTATSTTTIVPSQLI